MTAESWDYVQVVTMVEWTADRWVDWMAVLMAYFAAVYLVVKMVGRWVDLWENVQAVKLAEHWAVW